MTTRRTAILGWMVAAGIGFVAATGVAGKPERDRQAELKPKVVEAEGKVKAACGCGVKINVKYESYATADNMFRIPYALEQIVSASTAQCNSDDNKKAMCKGLSGYEVSYGKDVGDPALKGKVITLLSNDNMANSEAQLKTLLDKF